MKNPCCLLWDHAKLVTRTLALLAILHCTSAWAVLVSTSGQDTPGCDTLSVPTTADELGNSSFPPNERVSASYVVLGTNIGICGAGSSENDVLLTITNLTEFAFSDLWYVADPLSSFSNTDGLINGELALQIDDRGTNAPLILGDDGDGRFEPGESWAFVIQDYFSVYPAPVCCIFHPPDDLGTPGYVGGDNYPAGMHSSGSIIGRFVSEPPTFALVAGAIFLVPLLRRRSLSPVRSRDAA